MGGGYAALDSDQDDSSEGEQTETKKEPEPVEEKPEQHTNAL